MQWYIKGESTSFDLCSDILRESQQALIMQWYIMKGVQLYIKGGSTSFVYAVGYGGKKFTSFDYAMICNDIGGGGGGGGGGVNKLRLHSDIWRGQWRSFDSIMIHVWENGHALSVNMLWFWWKLMEQLTNFDCTVIYEVIVNSSPQYMHQWTGSALVQIMVCHLFDTKPLPEPMLTYC